jgi:hypothetical protein
VEGGESGDSVMLPNCMEVQGGWEVGRASWTCPHGYLMRALGSGVWGLWALCPGLYRATSRRVLCLPSSLSPAYPSHASPCACLSQEGVPGYEDAVLVKLSEEDYEGLENDQLLVQSMVSSRYLATFEREVSVHV